MIEIFYIIVQVLFILTIFSLPAIFINKKYYFKELKINFFDKISINLIFFINILLLASILNIPLNYILYGLIALILILLLMNLKKITKIKIKIDYLFIILFLFILLISIDIADQLYFGWDAKSIWIFKTLNFYQGQNFENLTKFNVPDYPHLGSFIWSFFWKFPFNSLEYLGRIFYVFIYVLSILSFSNCLKLEVFEKIIFGILLILLTYNYDLFSGLQDVLIFSTILFFLRISYLIFDKKKNSDDLFLVFILLSIINVLFWFKNEGIFYGLFLMISFLLTSKFSKTNKLYLIFGISIVFIFRVFIFNYYNIDLNDDYFQFKETISLDFFSIINKVKIITYYIFIYLTQHITYLITLPLLFLLIIKNSNKNIVNFVLYFLIFDIIFIYLTYIFKMTETELLIKASLSRVIFQTSGFYFIILVTYINSSINSSKN